MWCLIVSDTIIIPQRAVFVKAIAASKPLRDTVSAKYCGLHDSVKCCIMETEVFTFQNRINFTRAITKGLC